MKQYWKKIFGICAICAVCLTVLSSCDREPDPIPEDPELEDQNAEETPVTYEGMHFEKTSRQDGCVLIKYEGGAETVRIPAVYDGLPVTEIGQGAFSKNCGEITELIVPNSVTKINEKGFRGCYKLRKLTLSKNLTYIGPHAFESCGQLEELYIPDGVTCIEEYAFNKCHGLEKLRLPNSLTKVGKHSFDGIPESCFTSYEGGIYLGNSHNPYLALYGCEENLETFIACGATRVVADEAFANQTSLKSVTLAGEVTNVPNHAFLNCPSLENISIGMNVKEIERDAFLDCSGLRKIQVSPLNEWYMGEGNCLVDIDRRTLVLGCADSVIPDDGSVRVIGEYAFYNQTDLTYLVIPQSVHMVEAYAFSKCENLTELFLSNGIKIIEENAFDKYTKLNYVYYEGTVQDWEQVIVRGTVGFGTLATLCTYAEERPLELGPYWRYVDGVPTRWTYIGDN